MKEFPLISVIITIYNVELYLRECIESILNQSYKELEIILVDDGSTDGCLEICKEYKKTDTRIKLISKKNGGLVSARKAGLLAARGDYISYVDADDWVESQMYQIVYEKGILYDADLICLSSYKSYADGRKEKIKIGFEEGIYDRDNIEKEILPKWIEHEKFFEWMIPLQTWRHVYKRELLWNNQLQVDNRIVMGEDVACCFPCYLQAERLCIIEEYLYNYRQRDNSMKRTLPKEKNIGYLLLYKRINQCINEFGLLYDMLRKQMIFLLFYNMLVSSNYLFLEHYDIAFPFNIPKCSKVIIYGAGVFGEKIYLSFKQMNVCDIKLWVDSNFKRYRNVENPNRILEENYDYILLTVLSARTRDFIRSELVGLGIPGRKIVDIDSSLFTLECLERVLNSI